MARGKMPNLKGAKILGKTSVPLHGGADLSKFEKQDFINAGNDARTLMADSPIVRKLVLLDIISRRVYMVARQALDKEINTGWEVHNPYLVVQTLVQSAQDKANEKFTAAELLAMIEQSLVPVMRVFVQMEEEAKNAGAILSGSGHQPPPGGSAPPSQ